MTVGESKMYTKFIKVFIDFMLSLLILGILLPFFFILVIVLLLTNHGSPFYYQDRPGKNGQIFRLIKFKSMNDAKDEHSELLPSDERITPIGSFLRRFSLDELPQIFNVIKGDMSLIGPRPLRVEYLNYYDSFQKRRHEVKPGITGWAQVNGRNAISWEKKFELDIWYIENINFLLDIKILYLTFIKVFRKEGISPNDRTITEPFKGIKLNG